MNKKQFDIQYKYYRSALEKRGADVTLFTRAFFRAFLNDFEKCKKMPFYQTDGMLELYSIHTDECVWREFLKGWW